MLHPTAKNILVLCTPCLILLATPTSVYAGTINLSPSSGSFQPNRPFAVDVVIDEKEYAFNAAQATVTLSDNLSVSDVVLGNCDFSFIKTPSVQNPSFVGVILGGLKKNCTVYSLTLLPSGSDKASITISDGSIKRHGNAAELLTAVQYGSYTIDTGNIGSLISNIFSNNSGSNQFVPATADAATLASGEDVEDYTIAVKVVDEKNEPIREASVVLKPQLQATETTVQEAKTNEAGIVEFKGVDPNIYTVSAKHNDKLIAEHIINAKGSNPVLALGLQENKEKPNYWPLIAGLLGIAAVILYIFRSRIIRPFLTPAKIENPRVV